MTIAPLDQPVAATASSQPTVPEGRRRMTGRRPAVAVVRSVAMVALAALGILVILPAAIAAQAAAAL